MHPRRGGRSARLSFLFLFLFLYTSPLLAQRQTWREPRLDRLPLTAAGEVIAATCACDVDNDGDVDLVVGCTRNDTVVPPTRLWRNDGRGVFTDVSTSHLPLSFGHCRVLAAADIDGDGDVDLVQGNGTQSNGEQDRLWRNEGGGRFADLTSTHLPAGVGYTSQLHFADLDGDGDPDLVAHRPDATAVLLNDGRGAFTESVNAVPARGESHSTIAVADVDGDGDFDLVEGFTVRTTAPFARLLLNDGSGRFAPAPAGRLPATSRTRSATFFDADGDGDADLVLGQMFGNVLLRNDGSGAFAEVTGALPASRYVEWHIVPVDADRDGDLDLVCGGVQGLAFFVNDGTGRFADASAALPRTTLTPGLIGAVAAADFDGRDGVDLVVATFEATLDHAEIDLVAGDGRGGWRAENERWLPADAGAVVASADLDGDGLPDVFTGGWQDTLRFSRGDGSFVAVPLVSQPPPGAVTTVALLPDVDGDGDADLIVFRVLHGTVVPQAEVLRNDGGRSFGVLAGAMPPLSVFPNRVASGDIDGDGDVDLVLGSNSSSTRVLVNDGRGHFSDETSLRLSASMISEAVALGDLDGDFDLDLLHPSATVSKVSLNDGRGFFTLAQPVGLPATGWVTDAAIADLDGDGRQDIVEVHYAGQPGSVVAINRGGLTFQSNPLQPTLGGRGAVTVGDIDHDGLPDLVFAFDVPMTLRITHNAGRGQFVDVTQQWMLRPAPCGQVSLVDLDVDGDLDIVAGGIVDRVYRNHLLQVAAPFPFDRGHDVVLRVSARNAGPQRPIFTALALATNRVHLPWGPYGIVALDPAATLSLGTVAHTQAADIELRLRIPRDPRLVGVNLTAQGFVADQIGGTNFLHLTAAPVRVVR